MTWSDADAERVAGLLTGMRTADAVWLTELVRDLAAERDALEVRAAALGRMNRAWRAVFESMGPGCRIESGPVMTELSWASYELGRLGL